jgi:acyl carrier protein
VNADDIRRHIIDAVHAIAPEADFDRVDPGRSLRGQLDLDSFDFLNLLIDLHARLGVEVPEADYGKVDSLDALVAYLATARKS